MDSILKKEYETHSNILAQTINESEELIYRLQDIFVKCFERGNKILLCGNGGSAADAQHVAAEFINRFRFDRNALPAIALTTDSSILTCISNDSDFQYVFSRQVEALAAKGDILVGISTSGGSKNVLKALEAAKKKGVLTVGFTREKGREKMGGKCDYCFVVPSADTARIQEVHEFVWHVICGMIEENMFQNKKV